MRTCVVCRTSRPKRELLRLVRENGNVVYDRTGKAGGRGAYICVEESCVAGFGKGNRLAKALGGTSIAEKNLIELRQALRDLIKDRGFKAHA